MSTNRTTATEPGESVEQPSQAALCTNNCGFFSNPGCMGMCSMCFRDYASRQDKKDKEKVPSPAVDPTITSNGDEDELMEDADPSRAVPDASRTVSAAPPSGQIGPVPVPSGAAGGPTLADRMPGPADPLTTASASGAGPPPLRKKRCTAHDCRKRVGMMGFKCRCGGVFCEAHRYPESHSCEFDHKASERRKIADDNPVVRGNKLDKI